MFLDSFFRTFVCSTQNALSKLSKVQPPLPIPYVQHISFLSCKYKMKDKGILGYTERYWLQVVCHVKAAGYKKCKCNRIVYLFFFCFTFIQCSCIVQKLEIKAWTEMLVKKNKHKKNAENKGLFCCCFFLYQSVHKKMWQSRTSLTIGSAVIRFWLMFPGSIPFPYYIKYSN